MIGNNYNSLDSISNQLVHQMHEKIEQSIIEGIEDLIKSGALVLCTTGLTIVQSFENNKLEVRTKVKIELRDKEIIDDLKKEVEKLKFENKTLRTILGEQK